MTVPPHYDFSNHAGLQAVAEWDKLVHGRKGFSKRSQYCLAAALAIVNGTTMPPIPFEGNSRKPWRAAADRLKTINRILQLMQLPDGEETPLIQ